MIGGASLDTENHIYTALDTMSRVPSVTDVIRVAAFTDARFFTNQSRDKGRAVHLAIRYFEKGTLDRVSLDAAGSGYLSAYENFKRDFQFRCRLSEQIVFHPTLRYAGMLDIEGDLLWKGKLRPACIDNKSGPVPDECCFQTAGYNLALSPTATPRIRFGLQLKPDGTYRLSEPYQNIADERMFAAMVSQFYWKLAHGHKVWKQLEDEA